MKTDNRGTMHLGTTGTWSEVLLLTVKPSMQLFPFPNVLDSHLVTKKENVFL